MTARIEQEKEDRRKRSPARAVRHNTGAQEVDESSMREFIEYKN